MNKILTAINASIIIAMSASANATDPYFMREIDTKGYFGGGVTDINNVGQIAGALVEKWGHGYATIWTNGIQEIIDTSAISDPSDIHSAAAAMAINDNGTAVLRLSGFEDATVKYSAYIWDEGALTKLEPVDGDPESKPYPYDINNNGKVVGDSETKSGSRATLWDGSSIIDLTPNGATWSRTSSINELDQIAGAATYSGSTYATLWDNTGYHNLGALPGYTSSGASDINDAGIVVGSSYFFDTYHAFKWDGALMIDINSPLAISSKAEAINNAGEIVGSATFTPGSYSHAVLWDGADMIDLNSLIDPSISAVWLLTEAIDINNNGDILVSASLRYQPNPDYPVSRDFLLSHAPIPEPETYAMLLAGLGLLGFMARRRKESAV